MLDDNQCVHCFYYHICSERTFCDFFDSIIEFEVNSELEESRNIFYEDWNRYISQYE